MRISHKYKFVFLSNPQSGSTSIRALLDPYSDIISGIEFPYHHHTNARRLKAHFMEMEWDWDAYLTFTTIRNPWEKMVSRYHYGLKSPTSIWHLPATNAVNFKEFIAHPQTEKAASRGTIDKFAFGEDREPLVDHILKLEDIDLELSKLLDLLGIPATQIPQMNKSSHFHYSIYYDQETKDRVEKMCLFDVEYGQYVFENKNPAAWAG